MPQALQVHFRRLTPSEELVRLAKRRFEELSIDFQGTGDCVVTLERREDTHDPLVDAHVQISSAGDLLRETRAAHRDPQRALANALSTLEAALAADEDDSAATYLQAKAAWI
jgi:GrpB-like predicted nucleotidyltransferase (UPF0157 family)